MILGIGTDLVEVCRIQAVLDRWGERFCRRVFTEEEIDYCERAKSAERYAVRFAAKEAAVKALGGWNGLVWRDIAVSRSDDGMPTLAGDGFEELCRHKGIRTAHLTLSHSHTGAIAFVVLEG